MRIRINPDALIRIKADGVSVSLVSERDYSTDLGTLLGVLSEPRAYDEVLEQFESTEQARDLIDALMDAGVVIADDPSFKSAAMPIDLAREDEVAFRELHRAVRGYTVSSPILNYGLYQAVRHVVDQRIPGAIVESGVWRGGSAALCALTLKRLGETGRDFYLYDTFGMVWSPQTEHDGHADAVQRPDPQVPHDAPIAQLTSIDEVRTFLATTGYPLERFNLVKGFVQDTIPKTIPDEIAILRLDTDFYESTYHELTHLYPRLVRGGIILIDDYPTEKGSVRAVEQYFHERGARPFLMRVDYQGRVGVKL